jgi:hypothetical protein
MSRATPDQIIAHVDLLRAVDRLLSESEAVRRKRDTLDQILSIGTEDRQRKGDQHEIPR